MNADNCFHSKTYTVLERERETDREREEGMRMGGKSWLNLKWVERQPMKVKILVGVLILGFCLVGLRHLMKYDNGFPLFMASQFIHLSGIIILIFKLIKTKTCSGTSIFSSAFYFDLNFNYLIAVNCVICFFLLFLLLTCFLSLFKL